LEADKCSFASLDEAARLLVSDAVPASPIAENDDLLNSEAEQEQEEKKQNSRD
jgi:hypothetical protein